jgi:GMP synthase-like glutamine amidotransferase
LRPIRQGFTGASPTPELGWIEVEVTEKDELLEGLPNPVHVFAAHYDEVKSPPAPWRVLAQSARCAVQAIRYGTHPIWGLQAHPEIGPADARILLEGELIRFPDRAELIRSALSQVPQDDGAAGEIVRRFVASPPQGIRSGRGPFSCLTL